MVFISKMGPWLDTIKRSINLNDSPKSAPIGILAFETAKTMSRLLSLYKSLSENEIKKLREEIVSSDGVSYLNSSDESYLLGLACAEMIEDLDKSAATVARLGKKCSDFGLNRFDLVYTDLKLGVIDYGKLEYGTKEIEKMVDKIEKLVLATASLYSSIEALTELEVSERKLKVWKEKGKASKTQGANYGLFEQKIAYQRKMVRHFRETSMWSQTFDRSVSLLARIVCVSYSRICEVFGPHVSTLPRGLVENIRNSRSGPIPSTPRKSFVRFPSQKSGLFLAEDNCSAQRRVSHAAGPTTVGGCGLALRYANVIILAERYLDSSVTIGEDARENLYQMLPENLKLLVRSKLSKSTKLVPTPDHHDASLSEGWREALVEMLKWLAPMARDTVTWQEKKNFDKMKFESKPSVLLMQTLHFSDKEKAEATIAEVLVGLSCVYKYENRRNCGSISDGIGRGCGNGEGMVGARSSFDGALWS